VGNRHGGRKISDGTSEKRAGGSWVKVDDETRTRSLIKTLVWGAIGFAILSSLTYLTTGSVFKTTSVVIAYFSIRLIIYYVYERIWNKIKWGRK